MPFRDRYPGNEFGWHVIPEEASAGRQKYHLNSFPVKRETTTPLRKYLNTFLFVYLFLYKQSPLLFFRKRPL